MKSVENTEPVLFVFFSQKLDEVVIFVQTIWYAPGLDDQDTFRAITSKFTDIESFVHK